MPPTHHFEHLPLVLRERGPARFPRAPRSEDEATVANRGNRAGHTSSLRTHATTISAMWQRRQHQRVEEGLPAVAPGIPLLLKIDTSLDLDDLRRQFLFEIISEQDLAGKNKVMLFHQAGDIFSIKFQYRQA